MKNHRFQPEGQCYVLPMGIGYCEVLRLVRENHVGACWPEKGMTLLERMTTKPFLPSIVTEDPYIIGLYAREDVFVWDSECKRWTNPGQQTYGADVMWNAQLVLGNRSSIPYQVLGGDEAAQKLKDTVAKKYANLK